MKQKRALITGITGQDGSYLAELLLSKQYEVFGLARRSSNDTMQHIEHLRLANKVKIIYGDIRDKDQLIKAVNISNPDEIYNLASQSHVGLSFSLPEETEATNYTAAIDLANIAINNNPTVKLYQASSSEMFGDTPGPQDERSEFNPVTPYGKAKLRAYESLKKEREQNAFICSGILYNHESPRRSKNFVTRKISHSIAKISLGLQDKLTVGNVDSERDWGYAKDYVFAMWLMLQQEKPDDYVIATGEKHSVKDLINAAATAVNIQLFWEGYGLNTTAKDHTGKVIVSVDEAFYREADPQNLYGDASKARKELGWRPTVTFEELIDLMVRQDLTELHKYAA